MPKFIDLHNHVLPGLDDGARDLDEAVALVRGINELGFGEIHPTPHQKNRYWTPTEPERQSAATLLRQGLARAGVEVSIGEPAGENMWDELFLERQAGHTFPKYSGGKAFLLEFHPDDIPPMLPETLFRFRMAGLLPVIAHVERFPGLVNNAQLLDKIEGKAALTMNLSTLGKMGGFFGRRAARKMVRQGLIHALATDSHSNADLQHSAQGIAWLRSEGGDDLLDQLLVEGPRAILAGEVPDA